MTSIPFKPVRIPACPATGQCDGFYIVSNLPPHHSQANRLIPCACTRARQAATIRAALPPALWRMTFETFQVGDDNRDAFNHARKFAGDPWGQDWFFLTLVGPNRRGKTHLAAAIVNALLARGEPAYFESVPALLDELRNGYRRGDFHQRLESVKNAPVLVMDDLGAENHGGSGQPFEVTWAHDKLYQIVDHRVMQQLPTVFTTNLVPDMMPKRTASRLWDRHHARVATIAAGKGQQR
ncbi:MAG: ATP-binding protein [Thermoflexales bacterium]|nr:ATP-binding protein [Thermoflexales bacterium]